MRLKKFHIVRSLLFSLNGIRLAWSETAFRQEIYLSIILVPLALWLGPTTLAKVIMLFSWLCVIVVELINSAIEAVVDRISLEHHELSGRAKDLGSAAVFIMIVIAALSWLLILTG